jgi:hypothetical protein
MGILTIILAIIIVLLAYYVYTIITSVPTVVKTANLSNSQPPVDPKVITNPYSANYTVGVWVYVVNFNSTIQQFITYGDQQNPTIFGLSLDQNSPILYCHVATNSGIQTVKLTAENDAFPIQKWVYIAISVSNFIECYINGQFVTAIQVNSSGLRAIVAPKDANVGATFSFGKKIPVIIAGLSRWDTPKSAGDIYSYYSKGNGYESSVFGPAYAMSINVSRGKDNYVLPVFGPVK